MDDLFGVVFVIAAIVLSVVSKAGKAQSKQKQGAAGKPQAARPVQTVQRRPAPQTVMQPTVKPKVQPQIQPMMAAPAVNTLESIAPTVQVTKHTDDIFEGSMMTETGEGYDPCHEDELHEAVNPCELAPEDSMPQTTVTSGLDLSWTGDAMVKAVVMQEVLTRPCNRVR